ncbi:MAG: deoxyhypusine synthase family protein [Bryobacteraceae bacterium]
MPSRSKPLAPLDVTECGTLDQILEAMANTSLGARRLGHAWQILKTVMDDPECRLVLTMSGAMSIAKLSRTLGRLITERIVHAVVATGAVVTHSIVEECGMSHFAYDGILSDQDLYARRLNRIYDSIEPEENLLRLEALVLRACDSLRSDHAYASTEIIAHIAHIADLSHDVGLISSAVHHGVPLFVPALTDSEIGLCVYKFQQHEQRAHPLYDPSRDLQLYAEWLKGSTRVAVLSIGGGAPRNWAQQMIAYLRSETSDGDEVGRLIEPLVAGIRICPDNEHLGHLSGSTFAEAVSWGKIQGGKTERFAEIYCDATVVLPFLLKAAIDYKRGASR